MKRPYPWLLLVNCVCVAVAAYGAPGDEEARKALDALRADKPNAYQDVVRVGEPAVPGLVLILRDRTLQPVLRFTAANALGAIKSTKAVRPLIEMLDDPVVPVRMCAALALGKIGDRSARPALKRLADFDPFLHRDPATGAEARPVRLAARVAIEVLDGLVAPTDKDIQRRQRLLEITKEPETFIDDASVLPPSKVKPPREKLTWPFTVGRGVLDVYNNYQQATDDYVHAGIDILHPAGTEVRAVDDGFVAAIHTNYPQWKTHHFFVVTTEKDGDVGWGYVHVDPDTYTFKVGDRVRRGEALGKLVKFSVGENAGIDHLHLEYVRYWKTPTGGVESEDLADPLLFFDYEDRTSPVVHAPLRFVGDETLNEFTETDGIATVSGQVDIIAGVSDTAGAAHVANWMAPVVTVEITGKSIKPWRKLVLDHRGGIRAPREASVLYVSHQDKRPWLANSNLPVHFLRVTNTDGDGVIEPADRAQNWDTTKVPDGIYEVTVRAWDLKGNAGRATAKVRVSNRK